MICAVPKERLGLIWPRAAPFIAGALARPEAGDRVLPHDILELLARDQAQLWIAWVDGAVAAAMVSEILDHPRSRECVVLVVGGRNMHNWVGDWLETIAAYARHNGCSLLSASGRQGWQRVIPQHLPGARPTYGMQLRLD
jgi:hypothetical protein